MSLEPEFVAQTIKELSDLYTSINEEHAKHAQQQDAETEALNTVHALVGEALAMAQHMKDWQKEFIEICGECDVVLCCRVSPMQKADIVSFVKTTLKKTTLAIGDGANDVNMILEAHVGVGICGVEGTSAVNNADYALPQFKGLATLMLVHGRLCYLRLSTLICYFFYKNLLFTLCIFFFNCYCTCSGQFMFNEWGVSLYNTIFTQMPVLIYAILEHDVRPNHALANPQLYLPGQRGDFFSTKVFLCWVAEGVWGAAVCFFVPIYAFSIPNEDGQLLGMWAEGTAIMSSIIMTVTLRLCVETTFWTWIHMLFYGISLASWYAFVALLSIISYTGTDTGAGDSSSYGIFDVIVPVALYWIISVTSCLISLIPMFIIRVITNATSPSTTFQVRNEVLGDGHASMEDTPDFSVRTRSLSGLSTASWHSAGGKKAISNTSTYEGNDNENNPARTDSISSLIKSAQVTVLCKRWVRRFRNRKALRARGELPALETLHAATHAPHPALHAGADAENLKPIA